MSNRGKIEELRRMVQEDPADSLTYFLLGTELEVAGENHEAIDAFERCIALDPNHTAAYRRLGDAWRFLGDAPRAREWYEKAIAVADRTGDLQVAKEARAFLKKLRPPSDA